MTNPLFSKSLERPRYSLVNPKAPFAFTNSQDLPFEIVRKMLWDSKAGFSELSGLAQAPFVIYHVIDWQSNRHGAIWQVQRTRLKADYYWMMLRPEMGKDKQPHVMEHYWIKLK